MATELVVRRYGAGASVLLLHGLFGAAKHWHHVAVRLAGRRGVVTVDLPNHGRSPHVAQMDYRSMVDDLLRLLDREGLDRVSLVGHSMGGKLAMALALLASERVERLAVTDIAPIAYADIYTRIAKAAHSLDVARLSDRGAADARLAAQVDDAALRAMLLQNLARTAEGGWGWRIGWPGILRSLAGLTGFPAELATRRNEVPTLCLCGAASNYVEADGERAFLACFPRATIERLAGAGHWVHVDRPVELAMRLDAFLPTSTDAQAACAASKTEPSNSRPR